ncbi:MAG: hypothetical protein K2I69_03785 [Muribaculaceae bacterium]|nr:hypothetical protein [Muribaculaceae bacterium]
MTARKLLFALFMLVLCAGFSATAQQSVETPVRWRLIVKPSADGKSGELTVKALITPGWHLYGLELPAGGPKATSFDFAGSTGVEFTDELKPERAALKVEDAMFNMTLSWWDANVQFKRSFRILDPDNAVIKCKVSYMTCDGESCRPPKSENFVYTYKPKK